MGNIPLPALSIQPNTQSPLDEYMRAAQLKSTLQESQMRQQEMTLRNQQIQDQNALTQAMKEWNPTDGYGALSDLALKHGGSGNASLQIQQHAMELQQKREQLTQEQRDNYVKNQSAFGNLLQGVEGVPDEQLAGHAMNVVAQAQSNHLIPDMEAEQYKMQIGRTSDPQQLRQMIDQTAKLKQGAAAVIGQKKTAAETEKAEADAKAAAALTKQREATSAYYAAHGGAEGVPAEVQQMNSAIEQGKGKITPANYPAWKAGQTAQAELPAKIAAAKAETQARQDIQQGNPADAGKLLADGSLTLADLKTRGSTPAFIEKATQEAQKIDKSYNPADEIISEHVAKSPQLNTFFGSANSLVNKGGTLDQLEELGKKIPQHDWPVINSIDDWQKLARGKGPLAAYAATALGVADDYGKVMGGGNASDNARDKALSLFAEKASPDQRHDAVNATRNAVLSQRNSRIGNNKFLKREYGSEELGGQGGAATVTTNKVTPGNKAPRKADGTIDWNAYSQ